MQSSDFLDPPKLDTIYVKIIDIIGCDCDQIHDCSDHNQEHIDQNQKRYIFIELYGIKTKIYQVLNIFDYEVNSVSA